MNELVIAIGLLLFIEGLLYAIFPIKNEKYVKNHRKILCWKIEDRWFGVFNFRIYYSLLWKAIKLD